MECDDDTDWKGHIIYIDNRNTRQERKPPDAVRGYGGLQVEFGGGDQLLPQPGGEGDGPMNVRKLEFGRIGYWEAGQMNMMKDVYLGADLGNRSGRPWCGEPHHGPGPPDQCEELLTNYWTHEDDVALVNCDNLL